VNARRAPLADDHLDRNPPVDAPDDPFAAIEAIELLGVEEVEHAARARARQGLDVWATARSPRPTGRLKQRR